MEKAGQTANIWPLDLWSMKNQDFFSPTWKKESAQQSRTALPDWPFPKGNWLPTLLQRPHQSENYICWQRVTSPFKAKHGDVMLLRGEGHWWGRYLNKKMHLLRSKATGGQAPGPTLPAKLFPPRGPSCLPACLPLARPPRQPHLSIPASTWPQV